MPLPDAVLKKFILSLEREAETQEGGRREGGRDEKSSRRKMRHAEGQTRSTTASWKRRRGVGAIKLHVRPTCTPHCQALRASPCRPVCYKAVGASLHVWYRFPKVRCHHVERRDAALALPLVPIIRKRLQLVPNTRKRLQLVPNIRKRPAAAVPLWFRGGGVLVFVFVFGCG